MLWTRYDCDSPPSPRYGHTAVALDARSLWGTELVVIFGGSSKQEGGRRALGDVVVFQVDSGSWFRPELRSAATPGSRAFHCAVGVGMRMFVFGGHVAVPDAEQQSFVRTYFNDMWYLSADSWEWTLLTVPEEGRPCGRDLASMVAIDDDRILLFGGRTDAGKSLNDLWLFEIKGSKWTNLQAGGNVPGARMKHQLVYSPDHRLLFLHGGETSTGSLFDDLWSIRGVDGQEPWQWTQIKLRPRPSGRSGHAMSVFGSSVLCYGGHVTAAGFAFFSQNHFYSKELWVLDLKEMRYDAVKCLLKCVLFALDGQR
ncbi:unnamed protein product [Ostreobium quekettii]|uniref:Uncharacterized protein n=1 Tax=Ostreobium quekettii TaxID=121088 RepID=A0A8S1J7S7_9CHLO|nr:unnamed protein product [Ostreobium quekettii]